MDKLLNRALYFGDNLEVLREKIPDESFDLIYLDPPFNSKRPYNVLYKEGLEDSPAQVRAFEDSWHWNHDSQHTFEELVGVRKSKTKINQDISKLIESFEKLIGKNDVMAYLVMMTIRLVELKRVLKSTGSIYLHCDPTASHYLKIVMDVIFGKTNFRNEIIWHYSRWTASANSFQKMHDIIFWYSKSDKYVFTKPMQPYKEEKWIEDTVRGMVDGKLVRLKDENGNYLKREKENTGVLMHDVWEDVNFIAPTSKERLGYATQKPEKLLEKIIKASSKEGDFILDPFCGCGTTVAVAERLNRKWIGIDITTLAINIIKHRVNKHFHVKVFVDGLPSDLAGAKALFDKDHFEFEYWALDLINAIPSQSKTKENMRGADKGIDGVIKLFLGKENGREQIGNAIIQVKGGNVQRSDIATLKGDVEREKAEAGVLITLEEPTQPMRQEAVEAGEFKDNFSHKEYSKIQILTIKELLLGRLTDLPINYESYYKEAQPKERENNHNLFSFL